jgi:hypothetical protein
VPDGERAQWHYDSDQEEHNIYYWYEGKVSDYVLPDGGYLDNMSSGYAPRFHEEMVRKLFISSAVALVVRRRSATLRASGPLRNTRSSPCCGARPTT